MRPRSPVSIRRVCNRCWFRDLPLLLSLASWAVGCGGSELATRGTASESAAARWPEVTVIAQADDVPQGSDGAPRLSLAFRYADGELVPIEGVARSFTPFRDGVALVDEGGALLLVSPRGARRVLASQAGAPPVRGPSGELVYVARHALRGELHVLSVDGVDKVVASGFANAGVLSPQPDGRVLFVAARRGGVAGLWIADRHGGRCLTNCQLGRAPWGDAYVPPPGDPSVLRVVGDRAHWEAFDGTQRTVDLSPVPQVPLDNDDSALGGAR